MFLRRHWIPPGALFAGQVAHGLSWILLAWIALHGSIDAISLPAFAWIHTVALGWFTLVALAVLFQVIPGFVDVPWRGETVARWSLALFGLGVALLVGAFLLRPTMTDAAAGVLFIGLAVYLFTAFATLAQAARAERTERAIARAFTITLVFLLLAAIAGLILAASVAGHSVGSWIAVLPPIHAHLGLFGWLSLLVFGVSAGTVRPITGVRSRYRVIHIIVGTGALLGLTLLAIGLGIQSAALTWAGAIIFAVAAFAYAFDILDIVARATVPHRPPQAFICAAILWLIVSLALGAGVLLGRDWQLAYGFVFLIGWVGQMVNGHMHHIGVRLIATIYLGDEDETRPQAILMPALSWMTFALFQAAIVCVCAGLLAVNATLVETGAALGFLGWLFMLTNLAGARARARALATVSASSS